MRKLCENTKNFCRLIVYKIVTQFSEREKLFIELQKSSLCCGFVFDFIVYI